ncbi:MAG TPA: tRNA (adenosine(37)-N6)-threonylcarbamoyltransferase complex dimerization subunit type 1 TsaB [Polyangiaceae bacterium]|nr:tRNA (adenosine(37)-N6)-threonylcarbamoyltransferase complex dimerization subunit type 1 TsaB [Polyangiaceae bacterium]
MRVLAIETSTTLASVALVEAGKIVLERAHVRPKQSAERLLPLIAELLSEAGWERGSLSRIGVSVGPGSFTGLRVGIACAQGLSLGLGIPLVGVSSLCALARAVPDDLPGVRCTILDARRAEVFAAAYAAGPRAAEAVAPAALPCATARTTLEATLGAGATVVWVGSGVGLLGVAPSICTPATQEPSAGAVGLLAEVLDPAESPALPVYIRDAGATLPNLGAPAQH